jgi:uncharacterized protein (TIGR02246 family)
MNRWIPGVLALSLGCPLAIAQSDPDGKGPAAAEADGDLEAIHAAVDSYVEAYNRGDAEAVARHWSEKGEWVSPLGERIVGREAIAKAMAVFFAAEKGAKIEVIDPKVRLITADAAIEEGTARVMEPGQPPSDSTYIAIHVKQEGKWKLDSVRETEIPAAESAESKLEQLDWMAGDWIDTSPDSTVETTVKWTKNKAFLTATFRISVPGMDDLEGTQVIGWDPTTETIRSWMFDSDGGFGEGTWKKHDNRWIVKFKQVLADGRKASSTNIYKFVDADHYTWQSIGREVDGQFAPNIEEVEVVRKGAQITSPPENGEPAKQEGQTE